jgi:hypothetical protein
MIHEEVLRCLMVLVLYVWWPSLTMHTFCLLCTGHMQYQCCKLVVESIDLRLIPDVMSM